MEDSDLSKCRKCGKIKVRKFVGYFPDGKNKKFVDEHGKQYRGRACPDCVRLEVRTKIKEKRNNEKMQ
jgi:hypothetical protein